MPIVYPFIGLCVFIDLCIVRAYVHVPYVIMGSSRYLDVLILRCCGSSVYTHVQVYRMLPIPSTPFFAFQCLYSYSLSLSYSLFLIVFLCTRSFGHSLSSTYYYLYMHYIISLYYINVLSTKIKENIVLYYFAEIEHCRMKCH